MVVQDFFLEFCFTYYTDIYVCIYIYIVFFFFFFFVLFCLSISCIFAILYSIMILLDFIKDNVISAKFYIWHYSRYGLNPITLMLPVN